MDTDLIAANGKKVKALEIFTYALQYFKEQALKVRMWQSAPRVLGHLGLLYPPAGQRCRLQGGEVGSGVRTVERVLQHCWLEGEMAQHFETNLEVPPPHQKKKINTDIPQQFHS